MAYNFGGKNTQGSQQTPNGYSPANEGKGSGVTINKEEYKPPTPALPTPEPQKEEFNTNIEGNVVFDKTIYSRAQFDQLVDNGFSELTQRQNNFNTNQFFEQYNRLFFEIPKDGQNSHKTLVDNSTTYLGNFIDTKDDEIARLNEIIADLQVQLATSNDVEGVREHPFFKNGTLIRGKIGAINAANVYFMDQGFARLINGGSNPSWNELISLFRDIYNYPFNGSDAKDSIPAVPDLIISQLNSPGTAITWDNMDEQFIPPSQEESSAQIFGLGLDPTDAALNPASIADKYGGDSEAYRIDLEKDYQEKTIAIDTLTEKINNPNESEDAISGYEIAKANLIARRSTVEFILENFEAIILGSVVVNVLPNITNEQLATDPGFTRVYSKDEIGNAIDQLFEGNNTLIGRMKSRLTYLSGNLKLIQIRSKTPDFVNTTKMYHKIWVEANDSNFTMQNADDATKEGINEALNKLFRDGIQVVAATR